MENQENAEPEQANSIVEESFADQSQETQEVVREEETMVPLHAVQKERRKRQELEYELRMMKENQSKQLEDDDSRYESVTKEDLGKTRIALKREIQEENWARSNPDKYQKINDDLPEFLKLRPNLASAIEGATNRYEEAWALMNALSPRQQQTYQKQKLVAPSSPSGVPKSAAISQSIDIMNMSDSEFNAWRQQARKKR